MCKIKGVIALFYGQCPLTPYFHPYFQPVSHYSRSYSQPMSPYLHSYYNPYSQHVSPYLPVANYSQNSANYSSSDRMKVTTKEITVFRFPQHSSEIDRLPSAEKAKMDALANEIADSFILGKSPIVAFIIVGHADQDQQGADFEMRVSIARAEAAQKWLVNKAKEIVRQRGGNPSEVDSAEFSIFGYGASDLYTNATTLPEREMNRRVVIKYASVEMDPLTDAISYGPNLGRVMLLVQGHLHVEPERMRRIQCALTKLMNPTTDDTYFEWGSLSQYPGGLGGLTEDQVLSVARDIIKSLRRHIANNNLYGFQVADEQVIANILKWEENVRDVKVKLVRQHGIPGIGQIHKSVGRYISRNEDNANSILSCFKNT